MDILPITRIDWDGMSEEKQLTTRHPVFFQIPMNWEEMTEEEKHSWALSFLLAVEAAAGEDGQPELEGSSQS
jgi:hypothetical protein